MAHVSIHAPTKGATVCDDLTSSQFLVSIHAPTKGATRREHLRIRCLTWVSIHAPTKGATRDGDSVAICRGRFNPRSHEGSDQDRADKSHIHGVSIHAPTKGATVTKEIYLHVTKFQSTLPRRERHG